VILDSVSSMSPCMVMEDDGYWNICHTHPIWVRAIVIASTKWRNHCERHITAQERRLLAL
jgi:hypothetical protein